MIDLRLLHSSHHAARAQDLEQWRHDLETLGQSMQGQQAQGGAALVAQWEELREVIACANSTVRSLRAKTSRSSLT
jgi:hypothetical protein